VCFTISPVVKGLLYCIVALGWRAEALQASICCDLSTPDAELIELPKQSVEIRNPQDQDYDYHAIQEGFDLSLHRDESVRKP